jgi:signal transduction histidine kinase
MNLSLNDRARLTLLLIPTIAVVLVLAVLLYRWSNEVSQATSVRLADSLQMSMVNWHLNLFRDFSDISLALRMDSGDRGDLKLHARRLQEWRASARYPDVIRDVYMLSPAESRPDAREWSPALLRSLEDLQDSAPRQGDAFYPTGGVTGWYFEPGTPALVRAVHSDSTAGGEKRWIVVELDRDVIQRRILPDLAHRYFMGVDGLDYLIAVVAGGTAQREVIYSSDPGFGSEEVADADGRMDVFGNATRKAFGSPIYVFHELSENARLSELATTIGTSWFPVIGSESGDNDWQLIVRHRRGGALGAFVAEMHRRDLAISFGVLSLLVVSVAILIVTSQRAHRLAKLQMGFVTTVSHELRTPLTIISSAAENITRGVVESGEQVRRYGAVIENKAAQLSGMVEEILLFAATRENRHRYTSRPLEVSYLIEVTLSSAGGLIEAARFTLEKDIPPNLPRVMGDVSALSQCLQNLITNALKYGGQTRWIGIRAAVRQRDGAGGEVEISVSDRGLGIEAGDLPHIFEPFYRSPSAAAAQIHGTGIGLSLAKSIAEAMNGRLSVTSEPGRGSTFTLHLPVLDKTDS